MPTNVALSRTWARALARLVLASVLIPVVAMAQPSSPQAAEAAAWAALSRPGAVVLFRHANAPGVGDPPGMQVGDCSTQRNLDEVGRQQARRIGEQFRQRGVHIGLVRVSQWCRAQETARIAFAGQSLAGIRDDPAFNSWFAGHGDARRQTDQARELLRRWSGPGVLVVVAHQVNLTALTGVVAGSAEGLVVRPAASGRPGGGDAPFEVVGRISPP
mgnify:CR=1 FL=1